MALKLYNTLSRKKEVFNPIHKELVGIYTCGPTIYSYAHIGNFRAYMCSDILKRYLRYKGFKVKHVMNLTDVDDKTIRDSRKQGLNLKEFTKKYEKSFFEDIETLNIDKADYFPKATEHIKEMVDMIKELLDKGIAYKGDDGSIYYDILKFKGYGKLSRTNVKELKAGARVKQDEYEKEKAHDFALWKAYDKEDGDVFWENELGKGRPGWHIECSAMSTKYLGKGFDIHTGGVDLIFPHHENEIAQSEGAFGEKFVNFWIHNEYLLVNGKKMSKSLGNFFTLRDLIKKGYSARAIRYLLLSAHYKVQLNFTEKGIKAAENTIERLDNFVFKLKSAKGKESKIDKLIKEAENGFEKSMDDDLNVSSGLGVIFEFMKKVNTLIDDGKIGKKNSSDVLKVMKGFDSVLCVMKFKEEKLSKELQELIDKREQARKNKDWKESDRLRDILKTKGIILRDTKDGVVWKKEKIP